MKKPIPKPSIVEVFEHYGASVHSGFGWQKVQCVLHEDRNPSASVNDDECRWRCFSCGESGDAVDLIMKHDGVDIRAAIEIANKFENREVPNDNYRGSASALRPAGGSRPGRRNWTPSWKQL